MRGPHLAAAGAGALVGAALLASEAAVSEVGAGRLGFLRYMIGLAFLIPVAWARGARRIQVADVWPVALLGIGQFGILIAFLNLAVLRTSSARVSIVFATLPLMTIAVAWLVRRTAIPMRERLAILASVAGVAILLGGDAMGHVGAGELAGFGLAALATLTGAICSVFYRPFLERAGLLPVSVVSMAAALLPLGLMALAEHGGAAMADWPARTWLLIGFVGLASGVGYLLWLHAMTMGEPGTVTAFLALSPVVTVLFSVLVLGEAMTLPLAAALALIVASLAALGMPRRQAATS